MEKVRDLNNKHTPLEIVQKVPWEKIKNCVVIFEDEDGHAVLHVSDMSWRDRMWLSAELQNFNAAVGATNYLEYLERNQD